MKRHGDEPMVTVGLRLSQSTADNLDALAQTMSARAGAGVMLSRSDAARAAITAGLGLLLPPIQLMPAAGSSGPMPAPRAAVAGPVGPTPKAPLQQPIELMPTSTSKPSRVPRGNTRKER